MLGPVKLTQIAKGHAVAVHRATGWPVGVVRGTRSRFTFPGRGRVSVATWFATLGSLTIGPFKSRADAVDGLWQAAVDAGLFRTEVTT